MAALIGTGANQVPVNGMLGKMAYLDTKELDNKLPVINPVVEGTLSLTSINGGQVSGMRNKIVNGGFTINQRAIGATITLSPGQYSRDRWKAGTSGCTCSFSTVAGLTTVTITAGTLVQVVAGDNLRTGTYVLSWRGTSQGRMNLGSYGTSGKVTAALAGGVNQTIEFGIGTLTEVQLELGTISTVFEWIHPAIESTICGQYFRIGRMRGTAYATNNTAGLLVIPIQFSPLMRVSPIVTLNHAAGNAASFTINDLGVEGFNATFVKGDADPYITAVYDWGANAEL